MCSTTWHFTRSAFVWLEYHHGLFAHSTFTGDITDGKIIVCLIKDKFVQRHEQDKINACDDYCIDSFLITRTVKFEKHLTKLQPQCLFSQLFLMFIGKFRERFIDGIRWVSYIKTVNMLKCYHVHCNTVIVSLCWPGHSRKKYHIIILHSPNQLSSF